MNDLVPTDPSGTGTDWLTNLINATANAYTTVKQADALKAQQLGQNGYYLNGQFIPNSAASTQQSFPMVWLLLGAGVLLLVVMEK